MAKRNTQSAQSAVRQPEYAPSGARPARPRRQATAPLVTVASALVSGGTSGGATGSVEALSAADENGVDLRVHFGTPRLSKTGKAYVVTYGTQSFGAVKVAVTAYIPIAKQDRPRPTRVGDTRGFNPEADAAEDFYGR